MKNLELEVADGKYKIVIDDKYNITAYRHGEYWQCLTGDNLIYNLAYELDEARKKTKKLKNNLSEEVSNSGWEYEQNIIRNR